MRAKNLPAPAVPLIALVVAGLIAGLAGFVSNPDTPRPGGGPAGPVLPAATRGIVQSTTATRLTMTTDAGPRTYDLPAGVAVEALRPIDLPAVRVGDWLNAGAVRNAQTLFALTGLIVIPESLVRVPEP